MTPFGSGLIAVGVDYEQRLPILGPTPAHNGRIWSSDDGRAWEDVTPPDGFANVALKDVIQRTDGMLLAVGDVAEPNQYGDLETVGIGAGQSSDGITWEEADIGLPSDRWIRDLVQGDQGIVAVAWKVGDTHGSEIWFSADGRSWERIRHLNHGAFGLDAGTEGFVAVGGTDQYIEDAATFALASADGREWFEAANPPQSGVSVAAIGGDWVALSANEELDEGWIATSTSENGLDWSVPTTVEADEVRSRTDDDGCPLVPSLISTGERVILRTFLGGLCSEGGVRNFGPHLVRTDAGDWQALPFAPRDAESGGSGSWVSAAEVLDGTLVLAGEVNGQAAFWWAEQ